jgi:hypothetical protein
MPAGFQDYSLLKMKSTAEIALKIRTATREYYRYCAFSATLMTGQLTGHYADDSGIGSQSAFSPNSRRG